MTVMFLILMDVTNNAKLRLDGHVPALLRIVWKFVETEEGSVMKFAMTVTLADA